MTDISFGSQDPAVDQPAQLASVCTSAHSTARVIYGACGISRLKMVYTSETVQGQVYFPIVNYVRECCPASCFTDAVITASLLVMIGTIVMVAAFKNLANLTNAYGFAVSTVMFITTSLVAIQTYYTKHLPWFIAIGFFAVSSIALASIPLTDRMPRFRGRQIFGFFDGAITTAPYLQPNSYQLHHRAILGSIVAQGPDRCLGTSHDWRRPVSISSCHWSKPRPTSIHRTFIMFFWTWSKGLEDTFDGMNRKNLRNFIAVDATEDNREKRVRRRMDSIQPTKTAATLTYVAGDTIRSAADDKEEDDSLEVESDLKSAVSTLYLVAEDEAEPRRPLARLNTCAVFHKLTAGRGVPHTFYGFLRQWPALPRVVVSGVTTCLVSTSSDSLHPSDLPLRQDDECQSHPTRGKVLGHEGPHHPRHVPLCNCDSSDNDNASA